MMFKLRLLNLVLASTVFTLMLLNIVMVGGLMVNSPSKVSNDFLINLKYDAEEVVTDNQLDIIVGIPLNEKTNVKNVTLANIDSGDEVLLSYLFDNSTEALYTGTIPVNVTKQDQTTLNLNAIVNFNNGSMTDDQFQLPVIFPQLAIESSLSNITITESGSTDLIVTITAFLDGGVEVGYDVERTNITAVVEHQYTEETELIHSEIIPDNFGVIELSASLGLSPGPWEITVTASKPGYVTNETIVGLVVKTGLEISTGTSTREIDDYGLSLNISDVSEVFWLDVEQVTVPIQFRNESGLNPLDYTFVDLAIYSESAMPFSTLELTYSIKDTRINAEDITVYYYSEDDGNWTAVTSEIVSKAGEDFIKITISDVDDFGQYGLVEIIPVYEFTTTTTEEDYGDNFLDDPKFEYVAPSYMTEFIIFAIIIIGAFLAVSFGANKYIFDRKPIEAEEFDIDTYIRHRRYWTDFIFQRGNAILAFLLMLLFSIGVYVLGYIFAFIEFDGFDMTGTSNENLEYYLDFSNEGWGRDMINTPIFLFAHFVMIWVVGNALRSALSSIPKLIDEPESELKKQTDRLISNWRGLIVAAPFILYDGYYALLDLNDPEYVYINPLVHILTTLVWTLEWYIFGCVFYSLVMYLNFMRIYTLQREYKNLYTIIIEDRLKDLVGVGNKITLSLGFFFIANVIFLITTDWWVSDFIEFLILIAILILITVIPIELIESDVRKEQADMLETYTAKNVDFAEKYFEDSAQLTSETKIDYIIGSYLMSTLEKRKIGYMKVYAKVLGTLMIPVFYLSYTILNNVLASL